MKIKVFIGSFLVIVFTNGMLMAQNPFKAFQAEHPVIIDGKSEDPDWENTEVRTLDHYYNAEKETDKQVTKFRMLWDDHNLYVLFECEDLYITAREMERDGQPYFDDCAEIFLTPAPVSRDMHIGFELNLYKASNDFIFLWDFYQGNSAVIKSYQPDFEVGVSIDGTLNDNSDKDRGWTMEMAIPLSLFREKGFTEVKQGNRWTIMAVRQDRNDAEGNRRSTSTLFPLSEPFGGVHEPERFQQVEFVSRK